MRRGFSVVELLVVIGIIVILLAIVVPAIQWAIYRSELAACGANLKAVATGTHTYASDHTRRYPVAPAGRISSADYIGRVPEGTDLRPVIATHIAPKQFQCPLSPTISFEVEDSGLAVFANYTYWPGFGYQPQEGPTEAGMFRQGDRWSWRGTRFAILVADMDSVGNGDEGLSSHPDDDGLMTEYADQGDTTNTTRSGWGLNQAGPRGPIEVNIGIDDGSVQQYTNVEPLDSRMTRVPYGQKSTDLKLQFPRQ